MEGATVLKIEDLVIDLNQIQSHQTWKKRNLKSMTIFLDYILQFLKICIIRGYTTPSTYY